jgi:hypothetical protein
MSKEIKPTPIGELQKVRKKFKDGEVVELPAFDDGQEFSARLKRLSLLEMIKTEVIPNALLAAAQEIYEGKQRADIKKYAQVLDIICGQAMVEPAFEDVADILTDGQKIAIYTYSQHGVAGLEPFRIFSKLKSKKD